MECRTSITYKTQNMRTDNHTVFDIKLDVCSSRDPPLLDGSTAQGVSHILHFALAYSKAKRVQHRHCVPDTVAVIADGVVQAALRDSTGGEGTAQREGGGAGETRAGSRRQAAGRGGAGKAKEAAKEAEAKAQRDREEEAKALASLTADDKKSKKSKLV
ncbi:hypothetical protein PInf_016404 [Phytophthora infestans]|nr:hypothetical protein PInf_016404 [Phytophthora infestans]